MSGSAEVFRPLAGRTEVRLPYREGRANRDLLRETCGERTRPAYDQALGSFTFAREHTERLVEGLAQRLGPVRVRLEAATTGACTPECWSARQHTVWGCVCICGGTQHGLGRPSGREVASGLVVWSDRSVHEFWATWSNE